MLLLRIVSHNLGPFIFHGNKERSIVAYLSCSLVDLNIFTWYLNCCAIRGEVLQTNKVWILE